MALAALVAFLSASQDIVVDAWRIEVFPPHRQGAAMAAYVWGYRVALLIATTGVISAVGHVGWHVALLGVAALIGCGLLVTLLAPEPPPAERPAASAGLAARLTHAVIEPLRDFLTPPRRRADPGLRRAVQAGRGDGRHHDRAVLSRARLLA